MPSPERDYKIVMWDDSGTCHSRDTPLTRERALQALLALTNDPFWDRYEKLYGASAEQEDKDGFTACVRIDEGILYAVPIRLLERFTNEHTRKVKEDV
jgi:hypothetical protein